MSKQPALTEEKLPYVNEQGDLIIPMDAPERYHYWKVGALPLAEILDELNASRGIVRRYTEPPYGT